MLLSTKPLFGIELQESVQASMAERGKGGKVKGKARNSASMAERGKGGKVKGKARSSAKSSRST